MHVCVRMHAHTHTAHITHTQAGVGRELGPHFSSLKAIRSHLDT